MIKNLIFDLGDVLMEYRATEMLMDYGLSREEALALDDLMFYDPLWAILDKGTMTNEEVIAGYAKKYPLVYPSWRIYACAKTESMEKST